MSDNISSSRRVVDEAWNNGNLAVIDEVCADDFVAHDVALGDHDRETAKNLIAGYRDAFPDLHMHLEDSFEAGDKVVERWRTEGTFTNEYMGLKPTGRKGEITGINIDRYENGKLVENWVNWDNMQLMRDLGAIPEGDAAPA